MNKKLLDILVCPECKEELKLDAIKTEGENIMEGYLVCDKSHSYRITKSIPRFVSSDKYVASFSYEWEVFGETLLDSKNEAGFSINFFKNHYMGPLENLTGKLILEAGCGMGHFLEIAAKHGGEVVGVDLSYAVDTAHRLLGHIPNIHLVQADIFALPFRNEVFDFIYSFGVLHHTPDCKKAFCALPKHLKKGEDLSISVYSYNMGIVYSSRFWRLITTRLPKKTLYYFSYIAYPLYYLYLTPLLGAFFRVIFFVPNIENWKQRHLEMFDWYSPRYNSNHSSSEVTGWFKEMGLEVMKIFKSGASVYGKKKDGDLWW